MVLATGRRYSRTLPLVEPLGLHVPVITASGALVKDPLDHRTLFMAEFATGRAGASPSDRRSGRLRSDSLRRHVRRGFRFLSVSTRRPRRGAGRILGDERRLRTRCGRDWSTAPPPGIFAGFAMGNRGAMLALATSLEQQLGEHLSIHVLRSPRYRGFMCEIAPMGVTKWHSVLRLADEWGISPDEICAVGDDVNDIPMIRGAGLGVAMGNALDEVKAAADRIAPCNNSDGLVEVIGWLVDD